jgi:hypothetical protein
MHLKIIDDFFPPEQFKRIQSTILGSSIPWHYTDNISVPHWLDVNDPNAIETSAIHSDLFESDRNGFMSEQCKQLADVFEDMVDRLGFDIKDLLRIRASMKWPQSHIKPHNYNIPHIDIHEPHTVGLFYVNDSDGPTRIFDQYQPSDRVYPKAKSEEELNDPEVREKFRQFYIREGFTVKQLIEPKANRMVLFDGYQYHTSGLPISSPRRVILNINFRGYGKNT